MPNWVTNVITIKTKNAKQILDQFFTNGEFDFNEIIPQPTRKECCDITCLVDKNSCIVLDDERPWFDWYRWNNKYWGTKWNASETRYSINKTTLVISFDTPWDPPMPIIKKLVEKFGHNISIKCYEEFDGLILHKRYND